MTSVLSAVAKDDGCIVIQSRKNRIFYFSHIFMRTENIGKFDLPKISLLRNAREEPKTVDQIVRNLFTQEQCVNAIYLPQVIHEIEFKTNSDGFKSHRNSCEGDLSDIRIDLIG